MKKNIPIVLSSLTSLSIPVQAVSDNVEGLYGVPDSLHNEVIVTNESNMTRFYLDMESLSELDKKISSHIEKMYSDEDYASEFVNDKSVIYADLGINQASVDNDFNVRLLEIISIPEFRIATKEKDYDSLVQILVDYGLLNRDDFSKTSAKYLNVMSENKDKYVSAFEEYRLNDLLEESKVITPQCVTCISFAGVAVNVAAATNVIAAVVAAVYAAVYAWGGCMSPGDPNIDEDKPFGKIALTDNDINERKNLAKSASKVAGFDGIFDYIYHDLAMTEIKAFYTAAYTLGLIDTEEQLNAIVKGAESEIIIDRRYCP